MKCIFCGNKFIQTIRTQTFYNCIVRTRICTLCGVSFPTIEMALENDATDSFSYVTKQKIATEYQCSLCGIPATYVYRTENFDKCTVRYRNCFYCGRSYQTGEIFFDIALAAYPKILKTVLNKDTEIHYETL